MDAAKTKRRTPRTAERYPSFDTLPDDALLKRQQIFPALVPISTPTIWRWRRNGIYPEPDLKVRATEFWRAGTVRKFLRQKVPEAA